MNFPDIPDIVFDSCCKDTFKAMQRCTAAFEWAEGFLAIGILASIFIGPSGKGQSVPTVGTIKGMDWQMLAKALLSLPEIKKQALWKMAAMERLNHHAGGKHYIFWKAMVEMFR